MAVDILDTSSPLVFAAQSKAFFYCKDAVCQFIVENGGIPLNPFKMFDYFLGDRVDRDLVRKANNTVISRSDEVWFFGETIANGVLSEIELAYKLNKKVRFFNIATRASEIKEISVDDLSFEEELIKEYNGNIKLLKSLVLKD